MIHSLDPVIPDNSINKINLQKNGFLEEHLSYFPKIQSYAVINKL